MSRIRGGLKFCVALSVTSGALLSGCGLGDLINDLKMEANKPWDAGVNLPGDQGFENQQNGGSPDSRNVMTSSNMIGMQGGQVMTRAGAVTVPQGALPAETQVTVAEVSEQMITAKVPSVLQSAAPAVAFTPHGLTFSSPVTLTLFHQAASTNLVVLRLDNEGDQTWERVEASPAGPNAVNVKSMHFSIYNVSSCDPTRDPTGLCKALLSGTADLSTLSADAFKNFDAPDNFGVPSSGGSTSGSSSGGVDGTNCQKKCELQVDCVPPDGVTDAEKIVEPPPDAGFIERPACVEVEHEVCWEDCSGSGDSGSTIGTNCPPPPTMLPPGCFVTRDASPCGYAIKCDETGGTTGGTTGTPDAGSTGTTTGGINPPQEGTCPMPPPNCYFQRIGDCQSLICKEPLPGNY